MRASAGLLVVLSTFASGAALADDKPQLLVLDFRAEGVDEGTADLIMDVVTSAFGKANRFDVKSSDDIAELLNLEAGKSALGCDDASCMAEIAGAMGAEFVVTGRIGKLGETYIVKVAVLKPATAATVGQETVQAKSLDELPARLKPIAQKLSLQALGEEVPAELMAEVERASSTKRARAPKAAEEEGGFPWIGTSMGVGGVALAAAGALAGVGGLAFLYAASIAWLDPASPGWQKSVIYSAGTPITIGLTGCGAFALVVGIILLPVALIVGFVE
jgi:predicted Fe-Mo cluster-binding NifX family protein